MSSGICHTTATDIAPTFLGWRRSYSAHLSLLRIAVLERMTCDCDAAGTQTRPGRMLAWRSARAATEIAPQG
jgi:hypothetical protein